MSGALERRKPFFLITIDTEGDNLWARTRSVTTRNAEHLPRFQELCESHGLKPTYLTDHQMALSPFFRRFAADVLRRHAGEVGMHLHAWSSPPEHDLTGDDHFRHPYLVEYPEEVMRQKVMALTDLLEDTFGVNMVSHRAGRWCLDEVYARILVEAGYGVDCTVTPGVSWRATPGVPGGRGGADYTGYPDSAYFLDLDDIRRPGDSSLLEVPMTVLCTRGLAARIISRAAGSLPGARRVTDRLFPALSWLRPDGRNRGRMLRIVETVLLEGRPYAQFMLHSSELMPGGSPRFPDRRSVEALYRDLEALFRSVEGRFEGATLAEYHHSLGGVLKA